MLNNTNICEFNAEYYPSIPKELIEQNCKAKISIKDVSNLGTGFAIVAAEVIDAIKNKNTSEGLYRCVFPNGVSGKLATFKNENAYLGTIMNEKGFAGQARWIPAEGQSVMMGIDPVSIAVAIAMVDINKKLDVIQEAQKEILDFMHEDKTSKIEGSLKSISNIHKSYSFNCNNNSWKASQLSLVPEIKNNAESDMIFYRKRIQNALKKQKLIHSTQDADKLLSEIKNAFKYYNASVYLHSYATFVEVILGDNFNEDYLNHVSEIIKENVYQYMDDYTICYNQLSKYTSNSAQKLILEGIGNFSKITGKAVSKVPLVNKGLLDESLINASKKIVKFNEKNTNNEMRGLRNSRLLGTQIFLDNIETINETCNKNVDILFDDNVIYLCG